MKFTIICVKPCIVGRRSHYEFYIASVLLVLFSLNNIVAQRKGGNSHINGGPPQTALSTSLEWIQESQNTHNFFRSLHGSPPLILNDTLSRTSQYYANYLLQRSLQTLDSNGNGRVYFEHSDDVNKAGIGENLYQSFGSSQIDLNPSSHPVQLWYEEIKDYDFEKGDRKITSYPKAMIGHFTQMLWKNTQEMGTAYATHKFRSTNSTLIFVVAHYYPQGNILIVGNGNPKKLYIENVLPPSKSLADINAEIVSMNVKRYVSEFEKTTFETPLPWRTAALQAHNYYRKLHGSQEIRLNLEMCKVGQLWAENLVKDAVQRFNADGVIVPGYNNQVALNLCHMGESSMMFLSHNDRPSANFAVKSWYGQRKKYKYDQDEDASRLEIRKSEKFLQIVWNTTTEFCISYASMQTDHGPYITYIVANYYPPAATRSNEERKQNVPRPESEADADIYFAGDESCSCSTLPRTLLILLLTFIALISGFVGAMLIMRKYQKTWYHAIMKFLRLKKY